MATPKTRRKPARRRENTHPSTSAAVIPIETLQHGTPGEGTALATAELPVAVNPRPGRKALTRKVVIPVTANQRKRGRKANGNLELIPVAKVRHNEPVSATLQSAIDVEEHLFDIAAQITRPVIDLMLPIAKFFGLPLDLEIKEVERTGKAKPMPIIIESRYRKYETRAA